MSFILITWFKKKKKTNNEARVDGKRLELLVAKERVWLKMLRVWGKVPRNKVNIGK
jgi:septum formation topological specificity factor MinE